MTLRFTKSIRCRNLTSMAAIVHVVGVEVVGQHRLRLSFEDGASGELDFADWEWRGVFAPLRDQAFFESVALDEELGTIVWPNGADVAPETLHTWALSGDHPANAAV